MGKVIAIDGPTGAGKSTIAKLIAETLGFDYLDTGSLYRAIALALRNSGVNPEDSDERLMNVLHGMDIRYTDGKVFLHGRDISEDIRSKEIDHYSSVFSTRKIVRDFLFDIQRDAATTRNVVVEGRDTTTVIFSNAWKKIYLDALVQSKKSLMRLSLLIRGVLTKLSRLLKNLTLAYFTASLIAMEIRKILRFQKQRGSGSFLLTLMKR